MPILNDKHIDPDAASSSSTNIDGVDTVVVAVGRRIGTSSMNIRLAGSVSDCGEATDNGGDSDIDWYLYDEDDDVPSVTSASLGTTMNASSVGTEGRSSSVYATVTDSNGHTFVPASPYLFDAARNACSSSPTVSTNTNPTSLSARATFSYSSSGQKHINRKSGTANKKPKTSALKAFRNAVLHVFAAGSAFTPSSSANISAYGRSGGSSSRR